MKRSVVKVEDIPGCEKSENPMVGFHVNQYLLNRVADRNNNEQQNVHHIPPLEKMTFQFR